MVHAPQLTQHGKGKGHEALFEENLRRHTEGSSALSFGETDEVANVSTGEQVELDPVRVNSVYEIYKIIKQNFERTGKASDNAILHQLQESMGIDIHTPEQRASSGEVVQPTVAEMSKADRESTMKGFMHKLAEKMFQALQDCRDKLAAIKPETIGGNTVSKLGEKGDANFIVTTGNGEDLYHQLKKDNQLGLNTVEKNDYGFVVNNPELGFRVMFIYQERLHEDGSPKALEDIQVDDTPEEDVNMDHASQTPNRAQQGINNVGGGTSAAV